MTIAVIGSTGQLGRLVLNRLVAGGFGPADVLAIGRNTNSLDELAGLGHRTAQADMADAATIERALDGVETLLLISGLAPDRAQQHADTIDAAQRAGVSRIVYTSVLNADAPDLLIAADHLRTEHHLRASDVKFTILRNAWYTENHRQDFEAARQTGVLVSNLADAPLATVPRADLAEAAAVVLADARHAGRTYELSAETAWTYPEFAALISAETGTDVTYQPIGDAAFTELLTATGLDEGTAGFLTMMNANLRTGLLGTTSSDLAELIGRPATTLAQSVRGWTQGARS